MDLQPSQNNYNEGDRLQTSESLSGFFSRMTVSNKIMERIMRQDSNLSLYDGFRIGGIGKSISRFPEVSRNSLSDSFYKESEEEIKNLKEGLQELKAMDKKKESKLSLRMSRGSSRETSMRTLWHDKKDMQMIIKEHINLGLIEPGISAYSSPGFLVRNHGEIKRGILIDETGSELQKHIVEKIRNFSDVLKDKKHLQSFLRVVNFTGIFIKDLAKYKKDFWPLLKETESARWKWEEIHTQSVRELKQVCNNLPKLAIPQDDDELLVYTDANDYRWAAVLMK
ncbi:hypothetical protein Sango_2821200 [Sesamum angolense]|uniref:Reverse transcriptase/retrotransposon-derived protein RNase H-like domain-containing protein n=1 Tax=Sesamum angolense TaxID=2727404 RepID=A0AAE1T7D3_9LAMI|nr:hypothetical protein Sango_2821200 [Sesamum angolense]